MFITNSVLLCSRPIGRLTRLVCPSVYPSIGPIRAHNLKTEEKCRKIKIGINVSHGMSK